MAGIPFDSMYRDALYSLFSGAVMPIDRDILSMAPLPDDVVDPFASQDVEPNQIMSFTYTSLVTWIEEAKKANYFSKRFTDLSKLVLKGVTTMGRCLMTLHNRGEDLAQAPMQIGDLISVASYHFRKSYLGVIQTAGSHPEVSERLLINQLGWTNMLQRLYKTRDKLSEKIKTGNLKSNISGPDEDVCLEEESMKNRMLSDKRSVVSASEKGSAFCGVSALFEPGALSALRALSSLEGPKGTVRSGKSSFSSSRLPAEGSESAENAVRIENRSGVPEKENAKTGSQCEASEENEPKTETSEKTETPLVSSEKQNGSETKKPEQPEASGNRRERSEEVSLASAGTENGETEKTSSGKDQTGAQKEKLSGNACSEEGSKLGADPWEEDPPEDGVPPYLAIMKNAFQRSEEDGSLIFTFDEIKHLVNDQDFSRIYPESTAKMKKILAEIDSG